MPTPTNGFIKLPRVLFADTLWEEPRRLSHFEAYIDLLRRAAYHPTSLPIQGQTIRLEPGQLVCSTVKLAEQWGWHRATVWKFLQALERDGLLDTIHCASATILRLYPERRKDAENITLTVVEKPLKERTPLPDQDYGDNQPVAHSKKSRFSLNSNSSNEEKRILEPAAEAEERAFAAFVRQAMTGPKPVKFDRETLPRLRAEFQAQRNQLT
jgi:hypothetical protein